ncbi:MAG: ribonuclease P protein subunit [Promethearchaeota archaeon]
MKVNPKYLIYHDLIGLEGYAKLKSKSLDRKFSEIGIVIDESKNILITEKNKKIKKYIKKDYIFRFKLPNENNDEEKSLLEVNGTKVVGRPENRLRNLKRKRSFKK